VDAKLSVEDQITRDEKYIWIFYGSIASIEELNWYPSGIFESIEQAEIFIEKYSLSGLLTEYPVGIGAYDWAIQNEFFSPKSARQETPKFIGRFVAAAQRHFHYEAGKSS
jgi:hypothetical protein